MAARDLGISFLKLFPAEAVGGVALLRTLVFPGGAFCATGGVDEGLAREYLRSPNVPIVGGSWIAPEEAIAARDWAKVRRLAHASLDGCKLLNLAQSTAEFGLAFREPGARSAVLRVCVSGEPAWKT
jgi:2-keto-3-deoxy-6-phosphogluconate aldolase